MASLNVLSDTFDGETMKSKKQRPLKLYIGPLAWYSAMFLTFLGGDPIYDILLIEEKSLDQTLWPLVYWMWICFLIGIYIYPRQFKNVWYDKHGLVTLWLRLK